MAETDAGPILSARGRKAQSEHRAWGKIIDLSRCRLLFRGKMRDVYQHPHDEALLIKVIRPDRVGSNGQLLGHKREKPLQSGRTYGLYISFVRELNELLRFSRRLYFTSGVVYPFAKAYGLVETSLGLGLVVEKITSSDGEPAPTLSRLLSDGRFTPAHAARLGAFFESCAANHVVIGDLHAANLVYDDRGDGRFVCIDGVGEKSFVPIHQWSAAANRIKLRRARKRMEMLMQRRLQRTSADPIPVPPRS